MYWRDPHTHNIGCYAPIDDIAKVKTLIKGRTVPNKFVTSGKANKEFSPMTIVDFYVMCVHDVVKDVVPDEESVEWARKTLAKHMVDYDVPNDYGKKKKKTRRTISVKNNEQKKRNKKETKTNGQGK